jgi:hypothetical protein
VGIVIPIITDFNASGINKANKAFGQLETNGQRAAFAVRKAALPAGIALVALAAGAIDAANAAMQDQAAQDQLTRSLDKTTGATDGAIASVDAFITSTSNLTAVADDELRPALANLARGTGDLAQAQDGLKIALDISAATGKPLATVSAALSKAYAGNATALGKLDPHVKAMIKNGASADEVIAAMSSRFKGDAAASADTAAGRMKALGIAVDETKESIGAALMPIVEAILPVLQRFGKWAQEHSTVFVVLAGIVGGLALAIMGANVAMTILALNPVVLTIMAIVGAVALLTAGFILAYKKSETFRNIVDGVFAAVKGYVELVVNYLKGPLMAAWDIVSGAIDAISALIRGDFGAAWEGLKTMIGGVVEFIKTTLLALPLLILGYAIDIGKSIVNGIVSGVTGLGGFIWDKISGIGEYLLDKIKGIAGSFRDIGSAIGEWIVNAAKGAVSGLGDILKSAVLAPIRFIASKIRDNWPDFPGLPGPPGFLDTLSRVGLGATGGIVTRPTLAVIGEAGPEAVIPLNRTPGSSPLGTMGMGGITINVQAGLVSTPDQIGQQIIEAIQNAQRRSGPVFAAA